MSDLKENGWQRTERALNYREIALLGKQASDIREIMARYGVTVNAGEVSVSAIDALFLAWRHDDAGGRVERSTFITTLGITFGNWLCTQHSMQWMEVTDDVGITYPVRHENKGVYCFPFEAIKKRINTGEKGFFSEIERYVSNAIADPETEVRRVSGE